MATAVRLTSNLIDEDYPNDHSNGDTSSNHINGNDLHSIRSPSISRESPALVSGQTVKPIAIIGMSCRFPGDCTNPEKLWSMISEGRSGWSSIPSDRFDQEAFYHPNSDMTGAVRLFLIFRARNADSAFLVKHERWSFSERRPCTL